MEPIVLNKNLKNLKIFELKYKDLKCYKGYDIFPKILKDRASRHVDNNTMINYFVDKNSQDYYSRLNKHHFILFNAKLKPQVIDYDFE